MSIERELLQKVVNHMWQGDLVDEIKEVLAQPEQTEQEPVTDKPTETAMAVMPNGVCVSNVYDAYEEGRKSVMSEQENIQYLLDQVARLTAENAMLKEKWSTPKREPIEYGELEVWYSQHTWAMDKQEYMWGFRDAEKAHGITGGE